MSIYPLKAVCVINHAAFWRIFTSSNYWESFSFLWHNSILGELLEMASSLARYLRFYKNRTDLILILLTAIVVYLPNSVVQNPTGWSLRVHEESPPSPGKICIMWREENCGKARCQKNSVQILKTRNQNYICWSWQCRVQCPEKSRFIYLLTYMGVFGLVQTRAFCLDGISGHCIFVTPLLLLLMGKVITSSFFIRAFPLD